MPATRNGTSDQSHSTALYSLASTSKPRLASFTVVALKSHLKHFKLSTNGIKAALVDCLHSHLHCMEEMGINNPHVADTSDLYKEMAPVACMNKLFSLKKKVVPAHKLVIPAPRNGICPHKETLLTTHKPLMPLPQSQVKTYFIIYSSSSTNRN